MDAETKRERNCQYQRVWREANRAKDNERNRTYYRANLEKVRERNRTYRLANPEKASAAGRLWRRENPTRVLEKNRRRRALQYDAEGFTTPAEWAAILAAFNYRCAYCPAPGTTLDHVVPLSRGGSNGPENVVPACGPCNSAKRAKYLLEWLSYQFGPLVPLT